MPLSEAELRHQSLRSACDPHGLETYMLTQYTKKLTGSFTLFQGHPGMHWQAMAAESMQQDWAVGSQRTAKGCMHVAA